jgi:hypothetical protein
VYSRRLNGNVHTFGVTGKLWRNALVMYDHQTGAFWSHFTGEAILGPEQGARLRMLTSLPGVRWKDWHTEHPGTLVLSVGGREDEGEDTYDDYHRSGRTGLFEPGHRDRRLKAKERVVGALVGGRAKAYPLKAFKETPALQDDVADTPVLVFHDRETLASAVYVRRAEDGTVLTFPHPPQGHHITDGAGRTWNLLTGRGEGGAQLRQLPHVNAYWFAWADFHPDTDLFVRR